MGVFSSNASAEEGIEKFIDGYDENVKQEYLLDTETREKIYNAYKSDEDGNLIKITLEEYAAIFNGMEEMSTENEDDVLIPNKETRSPTTWKVYRYSGEQGKSVVNGSRIKVSPDVAGPGGISSGYSSTITNSFGGTFSGTVGDKIKTSASFSWNSSASTAKIFSVSYQVAKGKIGYVGFTPYLNKTWGTAYEDTMSQMGKVSTKSLGTVYGLSPKKLSSGLADGLYALVYK